MAPYLQATGHTWVIGVSMLPALTGASTKEEHEFWIQWTKANNTIIGTILDHLSKSLKSKYMGTKTTAELIKALKDEHNVPGIMGAYKLFKELLAVEIPSSSHPAPALNKIETLFTRLDNASHTIPDKVQAILVLAKLPASMDFIAQMIVQEKDNAGKAKNPTVAGIHTAAVLSWDQQLIQGKGKASAHANKLSAVKPKESDPKFQQQQQPQGEARPSGLGPNCTPWCGTC
jgi:hypothetical protein